MRKPILPVKTIFLLVYLEMMIVLGCQHIFLNDTVHFWAISRLFFGGGEGGRNPRNGPGQLRSLSYDLLPGEPASQTSRGSLRLAFVCQKEGKVIEGGLA
jgi:hypothetical protein